MRKKKQQNEIDKPNVSRTCNIPHRLARILSAHLCFDELDAVPVGIIVNVLQLLQNDGTVDTGVVVWRQRTISAI